MEHIEFTSMPCHQSHHIHSTIVLSHNVSRVAEFSNWFISTIQTHKSLIKLVKGAIYISAIHHSLKRTHIAGREIWDWEMEDVHDHRLPTIKDFQLT